MGTAAISRAAPSLFQHDLGSDARAARADVFRCSGKLARTLKPAAFTIYAREPIAKLVAGLRLRTSAGGGVEILDTFWNFPPEPNYPDVVPAPLAYADLLATQDGRNVEAARILYDRVIEPAFHPPS